MNLVRIFTYGLFSNGSRIGDWELDELYDKMYRKPKPFTFAEKHALKFFEEMGKYMCIEKTIKVK